MVDYEVSIRPRLLEKVLVSQPGKTEPSLGEKWVLRRPQPDPRSAQALPRSVEACDGSEWGALPTQVVLARHTELLSFFCTRCIYPHLSRATLSPRTCQTADCCAPLPGETATSRQNEANGPSGADIQQHAP